MDWSGEKRDGGSCQLVPELDEQWWKKDLDILLKSKLASPAFKMLLIKSLKVLAIKSS